MSLFDGTPDRGKEKRNSGRATKAPNLAKIYRRNKTEKQAPTIRDERDRITTAYKRGELKFDDTSEQFNLCRCNMFPDFHNYPHSPHTDELAIFELQYHGKSKR